MMKKKLLNTGTKCSLLLGATLFALVSQEGNLCAANYTQTDEWPGTLRGELYDLKHNGEYLYASLMGQGMIVSLPAGPVDLTVGSRLSLGTTYSYGLFPEGDTLYVGELDGIQLVDISDPLNMKLGEKWQIGFYEKDATTGELSTEKTYYNVLDLYKKENLFYLSTGEHGIISVDMTDPANPVVLDSYDPTGVLIQRMDVSSDGHTIYGASLTTQLHVIDATDPSNLTEVWNKEVSSGKFEHETFFGDGQRLRDVALVGEYLYVPNYYYYATGFEQIACVSVANSSSLVIEKQNPFAGYDFYYFYPYQGGAGTQAWTYFRSLGKNNFYRYSANLFGLWENPLTPTPLRESFFMDGDCYDVAFSGNYAFVADEIRGCHIFDITNPKEPVLVNTIETNSHVYQVEVDGSRLYLASGLDGFYIADISNPEQPALVAGYRSRLMLTEMSQNFYGWVTDFKVEGDLVYLGVDVSSFFNQLACVEIINIADPAKIVELGYDGSNGICNSIQKYGDTVFVVGSGQYLAFDVSNTATPYYKGHFNIPGGGDQIALPAQTAPHGYIPAGTNGLAVIDLSLPANTGTYVTNIVTNIVTTVTNLPLPGYRCGVSNKGDQLLVGSYYEGFSLVDISTPLDPQLVANYFFPGRARGAFFSEDEEMIVCAAANAGVYFFEKQAVPLEQTTIAEWKYNEKGDFIMTLSVLSGNLAVESSLDTLQWDEVQSATQSGNEITIPAAFFEGKKNCYMRIRQWQ